MFSFRRPKLYHYVITVEAPNTRGFLPVRATYHDVMAWDGTRHDALSDRYRYACKELGVDPAAGNAVTIFWSFEPNKL